VDERWRGRGGEGWRRTNEFDERENTDGERVKEDVEKV
jgi:hypothetical protein